MIPKHFFRGLLEDRAPITITGQRKTPDDPPDLTITPQTGGLVTVSSIHDTLTEPASLALGTVNAYLINYPHDQMLGGHVGALDTGKCFSYVIESEATAASHILALQIVGNRTHNHYRDIAYVHVIIDELSSTLYELAATDSHLHEIEFYSLRSLPHDVLGALAVAGLRCGDFNPSAEYIKMYGAAELARLENIERAAHSAFVRDRCARIKSNRQWLDRAQPPAAGTSQPCVRIES